jgi:hypothetical protein
MSSRKQTDVEPAKQIDHNFGNISVQRHNSMLVYKNMKILES